MVHRNQAAIEFLKSRKSAPLTMIGSPGPTEQDLGEMLEIAARVPDHGRLEPWRFIIVHAAQGKEIGNKLVELARRVRPGLSESEYERDQSRLSRAPMAIVVVFVPREHPTIPEWEMFLSAGAAAMNLVSAATAMGYGANWVTGWFCDHPEGRQILGLKAEERVAGIVHVGSLDKPPAERPRPLVSDKTMIFEG